MADSVPQPLYMKWVAMATKILQRNEVMNRKCAEVYEAIRREGFGCAVLKGQGVAELYNLNEIGIISPARRNGAGGGL